MNRAEAGDHLQAGGELDGLVLTKEGLVVARGKVRWEGTTLSAIRDARATHIQLAMSGDKLEVPLVEPVLCKQGHPVEIKFGPKWRA